NFPQLRITNGPTLKNFAALLVANIPRENTLVLSDDPRRLVLARAFASQQPTSTSRLFIDTTSLPAPEYHKYLSQHHPGGWPLVPDKNTPKVIDPLTIRGLLMTLAKTNDLYYLHPSFGYYFEAFALEPHGLNYKLVRYPTNTLTAPLPSAVLIEENSNLWIRVTEDVMAPVMAASHPASFAARAGLFPKILKTAKVEVQPNRNLRGLAPLLSR